MTDQMQRRLGDTLARRADSVGSGPRFTAEDIVRAGRGTVRRRRTVRTAGAVAGVVAVLLVAGTLAATGNLHHRPPAGPPAPTATPGPSRSASPTPSVSAAVGVPAATLGLDVLSGNIIQRPDGHRVTVAVPAGETVEDATRVPAGWVVQTVGGTAPNLWYVSDTGQVKKIAAGMDSFEVSPDGRLLVGAGSIGGVPVVTAYQLPSLRRLAQTNFDSGMGPIVVGISGDRAVLAGAQGSPGPSTAAVWNTATGTLHRTTVDIQVWGVSRTGTVLRRVDRTGSGGAKDVTAGCVDVVGLSDTLPTGQTGLCTAWLADQESSGALSPTGTWAVLSLSRPAAGQPAVALALATDLHAGQWRPVTVAVPQDARPQFWDTDQTVILDTGGGDPGFYRCTTTGSCTPVTMPTDLPTPRLLPRRG